MRTSPTDLCAKQIHFLLVSVMSYAQTAEGLNQKYHWVTILDV